MPLRLLNNLTHKVLYFLQCVSKLVIIRSQRDKGALWLRTIKGRLT
jgi:hypothetical protein